MKKGPYEKRFFAQYSLGWQLLLRLLRRLGRILCRPVYEGRENIPPQGPFVLVGNHQSWLDLLLIHAEMPQNTRWLCKQELLDVPLVGPVIRGLAVIPIDREGFNYGAVKALKKALAAGELVGLFPEATRVSADRVGQVVPAPPVIHILKKAKAPLVPFAINNPLRLFRKNRIVFGKPFSLAQEAPADPDAAAYWLLQKIYGLLGPLPPDLVEPLASKEESLANTPGGEDRA